jgi:hypothetical protein
MKCTGCTGCGRKVASSFQKKMFIKRRDETSFRQTKSRYSCQVVLFSISPFTVTVCLTSNRLQPVVHMIISFILLAQVAVRKWGENRKRLNLRARNFEKCAQ